MKQYKILQNPQGLIEAVKRGWSWPAFFFSGIWALVKKMYLLGLGLFFAYFVMGFISSFSALGTEQVIDGLARFFSIIVSIVFGVNGNKWLESNLRSRGFHFKDTVSATTTEKAISFYLKKKKTQPTSLEIETKKCPACAETIKLEAIKCRFCHTDLDPEEVDRQMAARCAELNDKVVKEGEGKRQCPVCDSWELRWANIEDGGIGYWCENCKKSLKAMGAA